MAEHRARNIAIVDHRRLFAVEGVRKGLPLADRHGRKLDAVGDVADREDARHRRLVALVDLDRTLFVEFDPDLFEPQPLGVRGAPGRHQHCISVDRIAAFEMDRERPVILLLDRLERRVELEIDALGHRNLEQPVADLLVIATQDRVAAIDDRHLAAEFIEDAGKLVGDIAAARDHHAFRQPF